jgi:hypothetical protein
MGNAIMSIVFAAPLVDNKQEVKGGRALDLLLFPGLATGTLKGESVIRPREGK